MYALMGVLGLDASLEAVTEVLSSNAGQQGPCVPPVGTINACDVSELKQLHDQDEEKQKTRTYWFVVWPESVNMSLLFDILRACGLAIAISPLHDKDYNESTGKLNKPHYHIIVRFPTPRYLEPVRRLVGSWLFDADCLSFVDDNGVDVSWYVRPVPDYPGALRYLCHIDNPEKTRYPENEVITFGFIDVSMLYAKSLSDDVESYYELIAWCRKNPGKSYRQLVDAVFDSQDKALMRTLTRYSYTLKGYIADASSGKQPA